MLEVMEGRLKFAKRSLEEYRQNPSLMVWLVDSAIYQLELSLADIGGFRLAHPEVKELDKPWEK